MRGKESKRQRFSRGEKKWERKIAFKNQSADQRADERAVPVRPVDYRAPTLRRQLTRERCNRRLIHRVVPLHRLQRRSVITAPLFSRIGLPFESYRTHA